MTNSNIQLNALKNVVVKFPPYCANLKRLMPLPFSPVQGLMDKDYREPLTVWSHLIHSNLDSGQQSKSH